MAKRSVGDRFPATNDGQTLMLSGFEGESIGYECRRCPRRKFFDKATLLQRFGDRRLVDLLRLITTDCPRHGSTQIYELCGAIFIRTGG